jgi:3-hydroxyacyl-CoA dehydrogenase
MHSARTVAALQSHIGLVEAGVGLLRRRRLKEIAIAPRRTRSAVMCTESYFETVAMAKVSASALEAKEMGLLRPSDIVFHANELLYVARQKRTPWPSRWRPPLPARQISVAGDVGTSTLKASLINMVEGRFASPHDVEIATHCRHPAAGDRTRLDRRRAMAARPGAQAFRRSGRCRDAERIEHTLKTGKPLRN